MVLLVVMDTQHTTKPQLSSLYQLCQHCLLHSGRQLEAILHHTVIPNSIHVGLFTQALLHIKSRKNKVLHYGDSIRTLVAYWPLKVLDVSDLFPGVRIGNVFGMQTDDVMTVTEAMVAGLLTLRQQSKLRTLYFGCTPPSNLFHLPVLYQQPCDTLWDDLSKLVNEQSKSFTRDYDDTMEAVSSWKLAEIRQSKDHLHTDYHGPEKLDIFLENKLCLTELVAMIDQIVGLCLQNSSPFRYHFSTLVVDDFNTADTKFLKWILDSVDVTDINKMYFYGKKKHLRNLTWELHGCLSKIPKLSSFGVGCTGPKVSQLVGLFDPKDSDCATTTKQVMEKWVKLRELSMAGLVLSKKLHIWLTPLCSSLVVLNLYACQLMKEDLVCLANCQYLKHLAELTLDKNDLTRCGEELCAVIKTSPLLELLSLRETNLQLEDKVAVLMALQGFQRLHTLALYEHEDMASTEGYHNLVELACGVPALKNFYVFPFNYKPFEVFYRQSMEEASSAILCMNQRPDMTLFY